jgi:hypothetical protein
MKSGAKELALFNYPPWYCQSQCLERFGKSSVPRFPEQPILMRACSFISRCDAAFTAWPVLLLLPIIFCTFDG